MVSQDRQKTLRNTQNNSLIIVTGRAYPKLAEDVANTLDASILDTEIYDFANGEISINYSESVRGADVFVFQNFAEQTNKWIMEQLLMIDALKRASAKSITAVVPCFPYARQDKKHRGREPISAKLMCDLLRTAGADRIISIDMHSAQLQGFFDGPVEHILAMPMLVKYIQGRINVNNTTVVSPDTGRVKTAEKWANLLNNSPIAFAHKKRDIHTANQTVTMRVVGEIEGRDCIIVDDIIDTAGTIMGAAKAVHDAGAKSITVAATHGIFSGPAIERLSDPIIKEVVVTDTAKISESKIFDKLTVLSAAPLIAPALVSVFENIPVAKYIQMTNKKMKLKILHQSKIDKVQGKSETVSKKATSKEASQVECEEIKENNQEDTSKKLHLLK